MMNRLRFPLAQICQRARAKPSQPRKASTPGTSGRLILDHGDSSSWIRELSSSNDEVSCKHQPPPLLSAGRTNSWARLEQFTNRTPYAVAGFNEYAERPAGPKPG